MLGFTRAPFEGLFLARRAGNRVRRSAVSCGRVARPRAILAPMFVGVADTCPGSRDLRGCKPGNPCWSFLPVDAPRPSTHKGPLPCGQGFPCSSSRRFPWIALSSRPWSNVVTDPEASGAGARSGIHLHVSLRRRVAYHFSDVILQHGRKMGQHILRSV